MDQLHNNIPRRDSSNSRNGARGRSRERTRVPLLALEEGPTSSLAGDISTCSSGTMEGWLLKGGTGKHHHHTKSNSSTKKKFNKRVAAACDKRHVFDSPSTPSRNHNRDSLPTLETRQGESASEEEEGDSTTAPLSSLPTVDTYTSRRSSNTASTAIPASHVEGIVAVFGPNADLYRDVLQIDNDIVSGGVTKAALRAAYFRRGRQVLQQQTTAATTATSSPTSVLDEAVPSAKERFQAVTLAYEILMNSEWKELYEQYGLLGGNDNNLDDGDDDAEDFTAMNTVSVLSMDDTTITKSYRPILKHKSRSHSWGPAGSRRERRLTWNEEVEELVYQPDEVSDRAKARKQKSSKKKKRKKTVVLIENSPDDVLDDQFEDDIFDQIEAGLEELGATMGGLVEKLTGNNDSKERSKQELPQSPSLTQLADDETERDKSEADDKPRCFGRGSGDSHSAEKAPPLPEMTGSTMVTKLQHDQTVAAPRRTVMNLAVDRTMATTKAHVRSLVERHEELAITTKTKSAGATPEGEKSRQKVSDLCLSDKACRDRGPTKVNTNAFSEHREEIREPLPEAPMQRQIDDTNAGLSAKSTERGAVCMAGKDGLVPNSSGSELARVLAQRRAVAISRSFETEATVETTAQNISKSKVKPPSNRSGRPKVPLLKITEASRRNEQWQVLKSSAVAMQKQAQSVECPLREEPQHSATVNSSTEVLSSRQETKSSSLIDTFDPFGLSDSSIDNVNCVAFGDDDFEVTAANCKSTTTTVLSPSQQSNTSGMGVNQLLSNSRDRSASTAASAPWSSRCLSDARNIRDYMVSDDNSILVSVASAESGGKSTRKVMNRPNSVFHPMEPISDLSSIRHEASFDDTGLQNSSPDAAIVVTEDNANVPLKRVQDIPTDADLIPQQPQETKSSSLGVTRASAFSYSSNQVARQLQGMLQDVAKQAEEVAKQAEEHLRALSPISMSPPVTTTTTASKASLFEPTTSSGDRGTVGGGAAVTASDVEQGREESLFSHFNDYIKTLANDVGILGNFFSETVLEPSRGISESFSIRDDEVDGILQVLDSELHSSTEHGDNHGISRTLTL